MKHAITAIVLCISMGIQAQNVGIGTSVPNANAKLDITATDKGLLIPRMDSVHRKAIPNTVGLLVFDSTTSSFWFNNGSAWQNMANAGWSLTGNSGTSAANNFLGTTDNAPLYFKVNNEQSGVIDPLKGNTAIGYSTYHILSSNGYLNTAMGAFALQNNHEGSNSAFGAGALMTNGYGTKNTAIGAVVLANNTAGNGNTGIGAFVLNENTTGSSNTASGESSMFLNKTGNNNTAFGSLSLQFNQVGSGNTAVGANSLAANTVDYNSAFGYKALALNSTGIQNTAHGAEALTANTTGFANTAVGRSALLSNTTGNSNTAVGVQALANATEASWNTAIGPAALGATTTGGANTAAGFSAMALNNTGSANTALGFNTLGNNSTGSGNTAIGHNSLLSNINGTNNTTIGFFADAGASLTNATAIGANAKVDASNKIRLGDNNVNVVESNGVFNTVSDGRFKYNIQEDVKGLDFIMRLRPVTYQFDAKKQEDFTKGIISPTELNSHAIPAAYNESNNIKRTGFIAQEVEKAAQKTGYDFDGVKTPATDKQYYSLSYASFVVPLVKAVQEQQQTIETLKKQNELLQQQNELIIKRLEALEKK